jgi:arsenite methyltransferase
MTAPPSTVSIAELVGAFQAGSTGDPDAVKSCCAMVYGVDLVALFLGESYHPGGADLTRHLADTLSLHAGERVVDVAAGIGTTALLLAAERDVEVLGVDLGTSQVARARDRAAAMGLAGRVRFEVGDAERLPVEDAAFDAAVCECAFCTFPNKATAAAELARLLRPGGRIGMTDVWLRPDRLDPEIAGLAGRVACLADARPIDQTRATLEAVGMRVEYVERHDQALLDTIEQVETRLRALRLLDLPLLRAFDLARGIELTRRAADVVTRGDAGYMLLVATNT